MRSLDTASADDGRELEKPGPVADRIFELVRQKTNRQPRLHDDLVAAGLDSLSLAELASEIEREFRVSFGEEILDMHTVGDLVQYVHDQSFLR